MWTLADLGVIPGTVRDADRPLEYGPPAPRRPRLHPVTPPDPTLPAFDRILALVQGSVKSRGGRVVRGSGGRGRRRRSSKSSATRAGSTTCGRPLGRPAERATRGDPSRVPAARAGPARSPARTARGG